MEGSSLLPLVFHIREYLGRVGGAESQVALGIVYLAFLSEERPDDMVQLWVTSWVFSELA